MRCKDFWNDLPEYPLEHILTDGGFCGIFQTIGVVGDSLAAGELESDPKLGHPCHDYHQYAWGNYLAHMTGSQVKLFAMGGMQAKEFFELYSDGWGFWDKRNLCQAYIMALGVNDLLNYKREPGTVADICLEDYRQNKPTFTGHFAAIIQKMRLMEPNARFFLLTMPEDPGLPEEWQQSQEVHAALMRQLAELFPHTYVIDLRKYGPIYDKDFHRRFFLNSHMNPAGYLLTARLLATYMDYIIRSDFEAFAQAGFIGTPYYQTDFKEE